MSNRDYAKSLIDQVPESKLLYVVYFLQGMIVPDETPNSETLEAIAEVDHMIQTGTDAHFTGSTADFFTRRSVRYVREIARTGAEPIRACV